MEEISFLLEYLQRRQSKGKITGSYLRGRKQLKWCKTLSFVETDWHMTFSFFQHWAVLLSLGITTFKKPVCLRYFLIIPQYLLQRFIEHAWRKTCINCRVKKMTTWQYIADVKQTPLSWWYHIHQIVAVYWRPWKSAYEIIPVDWKCLAHSTYTFLLLASSKQIPDDLQESHRSENFCKFVPMDVNQTNQMSRTGQQFKQSVN